MVKWYPIKFTPIFKEKIWGGSKLKNLLGKNSDLNNIGESWEISSVDENISVVSSGIFKGKTLTELITKHKHEFVGNSVFNSFGTNFPLLIKFIDAETDLSVQLHPNDVLAKKRHNSFGKTEMWYIIERDINSRLVLGFKNVVTATEYK